MAARIEHLQRVDLDATIYRFPATALRRRRRARIARRRLTVATILIAFIAAFLIATGPAGVSPASTSHAPRAVTIHPGQTLWDIADRYARPGADPRSYVQAILELNHLVAPPAAGARVKLPR